MSGGKDGYENQRCAGGRLSEEGGERACASYHCLERGGGRRQGDPAPGVSAAADEAEQLALSERMVGICRHRPEAVLRKGRRAHSGALFAGVRPLRRRTRAHIR